METPLRPAYWHGFRQQGFRPQDGAAGTENNDKKDATDICFHRFYRKPSREAGERDLLQNGHRHSGGVPCVKNQAARGVYFLGGLIMMCAPAVPGDISQGALSLGLVDSPVVSGVANGM